MLSSPLFAEVAMTSSVSKEHEPRIGFRLALSLAHKGRLNALLLYDTSANSAKRFGQEIQNLLDRQLKRVHAMAVTRR